MIKETTTNVNYLCKIIWQKENIFLNKLSH